MRILPVMLALVTLACGSSSVTEADDASLADASPTDGAPGDLADGAREASDLDGASLTCRTDAGPPSFVPDGSFDSCIWAAGCCQGGATPCCANGVCLPSGRCCFHRDTGRHCQRDDECCSGICESGDASSLGGICAK